MAGSSVAKFSVGVERTAKPRVSFEDWVSTKKRYRKYANLSEGDAKSKCHDAALEISDFLKANGIEHHFRGILLWGQNKAMPDNHFVVFVKRGGRTIVIDPTIQQFRQGPAFIGSVETWQSRILKVSTRGRWRDFKDPMEALKWGNGGSRPHAIVPENKQVL